MWYRFVRCTRVRLSWFGCRSPWLGRQDAHADTLSVADAGVAARAQVRSAVRHGVREGEVDGMALIGTRHHWEELVRSTNAGAGLDDAQGAAIRYWLGEASRDAAFVVVDALISALRHVRERGPQTGQVRATAVLMADTHESWWLHGARELGLHSIVPVEPWPRRPDVFRRPSGHLQAFGPTHPESAGSGGPGPELG